MNLLLGLPILAVAWGLLLPILFLDGADRYLAFLWNNPRLVVVLLVLEVRPSADATKRNL